MGPTLPTFPVTVAENGPAKTDWRDAWQPFRARADALVAEVGLRGLILRAGVDLPVGEGGATPNALQRRKPGLARALVKKPNPMLVDRIAQTASAGDQALRAILHRELAGGAPVWTAAREEQAPDADT